MKNAIAFILLVLSFAQGYGQAWPVWDAVVATAVMLENRTNHCVQRVSVPLTPYRALACGGWDGNNVLASTEYYSVDDWPHEWLPGPPMSTPRMDFAMEGKDGFEGYLIVAGGYDGIGPFSLASTEIFDRDTETWNPGPDLSVGRSFLRATRLADNRILFTGGFDGVSEVATVDLYDPATNTMTAVAPMNFARSSHTATLLWDNRVLVTGGFNAEEGFQMNQCEIYDVDTDTWTVIAPLNTPRDNHAAWQQVVTGGRVYDAELDHFVALPEAEIYSFEQDVWETFQLPSAMSYHHMYIDWFGQHPLVVGGANHTGIGVETTYDPPMQLTPLDTFYDFVVVLENTEEWTYGYSNRYLSAACSIEHNSIIDGVLVCGGDEGGVGTSEMWLSSFFSVNEESAPRNGLFPNPAVDRMRITGERFDRWEVIDASSGRIVGDGKEWSVEVAHLAPGRYNLVIYNDGAPTSHGFIKVNR